MVAVLCIALSAASAAAGPAESLAANSGQELARLQPSP